MPKTTIRVRKKLWDFFTRECKAASLRRDDLLDRAIPDELNLLRKMPPCDNVGQHWLKGNWVTAWTSGDCELQSTPVQLSEDVIKQLNAVCAEKGVPRDAFLDCALAYLSQRLVDAVIVIKNPRGAGDLVARVVKVPCVGDEDGPESDHERRWLMYEVVAEWEKDRNLDAFDDKLYERRLSYTEARIQADRELLEALAFPSNPQVSVAATAEHREAKA